MAKRERVLPARKHGVRARDEESVLMRSAESLGRMIGSLQRQLDGASRRLSETSDDVMQGMPDIPFVGDHGSRRSGTKKSAAARTRSTSATAARKNKRTRSAGKKVAVSRQGGVQTRKRTASAGSKKR